MTKVEVRCAVKAYNDNYEMTNAGEVIVESHQRGNRLVMITVNGRMSMVTGRDLIIAIENCMNVRW